MLTYLEQARELQQCPTRVRRRVDPDGRLPRTVLVRDDDPAAYPCSPILVEHSVNFKIQSVRRLLGRTVVGDAHITRRVDTDDYKFSNIYINKGAWTYSKGMGLATYLLAIEAAHRDNRAFTTDITVSIGAKRIWDVLVDSGVAVVYRPLEQEGLSAVDGEPFFSGDVRIPPMH